MTPDNELKTSETSDTASHENHEMGEPAQKETPASGVGASAPAESASADALSASTPAESASTPAESASTPAESASTPAEPAQSKITQDEAAPANAPSASAPANPASETSSREPRDPDSPFDPRTTSSDGGWKSFGLQTPPRISAGPLTLRGTVWIFLGFLLGIFVLPVVFIFAPRTANGRVSALRYCLIGMIISFVLEFILLQVFGTAILDQSSLSALMGSATPKTSVF